MKAKEVLELLRITRPTLHKYKKTGIIRGTLLPNGYYDYNEQDVYNFLNKDQKRKTYLYARVSTSKQKKDLNNQVELLKSFAFNQGLTVNGIYSDVASGISFEKRKNFFEMLDEVLNYRVEKVVITYKDRLSRVGFGLFQHLFSKFGTEIVVISEVGNPKLDSEEIFEEIVSLLHSFSMKMYSKRRNKTIEIGEK